MPESSRDHEPKLMDLSKARPPSEGIDPAKFGARPKNDSPRSMHAYDTSKYMQELRAEDLWPDESEEFRKRSGLFPMLVTVSSKPKILLTSVVWSFYNYEQTFAVPIYLVQIQAVALVGIPTNEELTLRIRSHLSSDSISWTSPISPSYTIPYIITGNRAQKESSAGNISDFEIRFLRDRPFQPSEKIAFELLLPQLYYQLSHNLGSATFLKLHVSSEQSSSSVISDPGKLCQRCFYSLRIDTFECYDSDSDNPEIDFNPPIEDVERTITKSFCATVCKNTLFATPNTFDQEHINGLLNDLKSNDFVSRTIKQSDNENHIDVYIYSQLDLKRNLSDREIIQTLKDSKQFIQINLPFQQSDFYLKPPKPPLITSAAENTPHTYQVWVKENEKFKLDFANPSNTNICVSLKFFSLGNNDDNRLQKATPCRSIELSPNHSFRQENTDIQSSLETWSQGSTTEGESDPNAEFWATTISEITASEFGLEISPGYYGGDAIEIAISERLTWAAPTRFLFVNWRKVLVRLIFPNNTPVPDYDLWRNHLQLFFEPAFIKINVSPIILNPQAPLPLFLSGKAFSFQYSDQADKYGSIFLSSTKIESISLSNSCNLLAFDYILDETQSKSKKFNIQNTKARTFHISKLFTELHQDEFCFPSNSTPFGNSKHQNNEFRATFKDRNNQTRRISETDIKLLFNQDGCFIEFSNLPDDSITIDGYITFYKCLFGAFIGNYIAISPSNNPQSFAVCIAHELGHAMGLANFPDPSSNWKSDIPPGIQPSRHVSDPSGGTAYSSFPNSTQELEASLHAKGFRKNSHIGNHCAYGIPAEDLKDRNFNNKVGSCIMFGALSEIPPVSFCPECIRILKIHNLKDFGSCRKKWV